jgi:hypothetical protein
MPLRPGSIISDHNNSVRSEFLTYALMKTAVSVYMT